MQTWTWLSNRSLAPATAQPASAAWRFQWPCLWARQPQTRSSNASPPRVEALRVGTSNDEGADYGPLVTAAAKQRVIDYIAIGEQEGAKLLVDGRGYRLQGYEDGFFLGGSLFDHVKPDMRIYKEEIFGPVLSIARAADYGEALHLCNGTRIRQWRRHFHAGRRCRTRLRRTRRYRDGRR